jgi:hypothetical protein
MESVYFCRYLFTGIPSDYAARNIHIETQREVTEDRVVPPWTVVAHQHQSPDDLPKAEGSFNLPADASKYAPTASHQGRLAFLNLRGMGVRENTPWG